MTASLSTRSCRSCQAIGLETIVDLGKQPDPDWLLDRDDSPPAPLEDVCLVICSGCGLVQLAGPRPDGPRPPHGHAMPLAAGDPWLELFGRALGAGPKSVCDFDGSSGLPALQLSSGGPVYRGLPVDEVDVVLLGHALNHVDDPDQILGDLEKLLAPSGSIAIDFHHVLGLVRGQIDVISHTHRCYLSLFSLDAALARHGFEILAVRRIAEYGGTVRVLATRCTNSRSYDQPGGDLEEVRAVERAADLAHAEGFQNVKREIREASDRLNQFLDGAATAGRRVVGYGAASRGTTFLNMASVGSDRLPLIVDRDPAKQGKFLPLSRIPVGAPAEIDGIRPSEILVLPWPSAQEIKRQLAHTDEWGARFVVALPSLRTL